MTREELNSIAAKIQADKESAYMTKRELVNALGCEKRTSGNVIYINAFLDSNNLITIPNYINGDIDERIELAFKFPIKSNDFQLYSLNIDKYKNLIDIKIDFLSTNNYCCFIGLNGSGKSNVIEAISAIFYSLYHIATLTDGLRKYPCEFKYKISYILKGDYITIEDGRLRDGSKPTIDMLPKNIIVSYSGEDTRLWKKYYKPIYEKYCNRLTSTPGFIPPFLFNISKYQWELSLLILLYSEDVDVVRFVQSLIKDNSCEISFEYKTSNLKKWEGTEVEALLDKLRDKASYSIKEFRDLINTIHFIDQPSTLFYYLYKCSTESESQVITKIKIIFKDHGNIEGLSEGEKKMIIANTMIHILSSKDSLCMFDEPDSHIHITRKSELLRLIDTNNRYNIITTHSPLFVNIMKPENIRHIVDGKVEDSNKLKQISDLSGNIINLFEGAFILSAPYTLIVEGTYDIKYLKKAIDIFAKDDSKYEPLRQLAFIPMGSAGNADSFFNDVIVTLLPKAKKIIYIFDYDRAGVDGSRKVEKLKTTHPKLENLFYQEDYTASYPMSDNITTPYYIEDMFDKVVYQDIIAELHSKHKFNEYKTLKGSTCDKIKAKIEKSHHFFNDTSYGDFGPLLDKLLNIVTTA